MPFCKSGLLQDLQSAEPEGSGLGAIPPGASGRLGVVQAAQDCSGGGVARVRNFEDRFEDGAGGGSAEGSAEQAEAGPSQPSSGSGQAVAKKACCSHCTARAAAQAPASRTSASSPAKPRTKCCTPTYIRGIKYPYWFRESAVMEMQQSFSPREDDVFLISNFPAWGLQRLLVALVEGRSDAWAPGLLDKAHFLDSAASRHGLQRWMAEVDSWQGRRCFTTHAVPTLFPCRYPFEGGQEGKPGPRIVVLVADPRNYLSMVWGAIQACTNVKLPYEDLLGDFLEDSGRSMHFGQWIQHTAAWSDEAAEHPANVRLFSADRLGSLEGQDCADELMKIADFIGVPKEATQRLVAGVFKRPMLVEEGPSEDQVVEGPAWERRRLQEAARSGHLIEQSARNLYIFEDSMSNCSARVAEAWKEMLATALRYRHPAVLEMASAAARGALSLPPVSMTEVWNGETPHRLGSCRPCVFALRGVCNREEPMCRFCHDPSHPKTKRASRMKRASRKVVQQLRTPSPSLAGWND